MNSIRPVRPSRMPTWMSCTIAATTRGRHRSFRPNERRRRLINAGDWGGNGLIGFGAAGDLGGATAATASLQALASSSTDFWAWAT